MYESSRCLIDRAVEVIFLDLWTDKSVQLETEHLTLLMTLPDVFFVSTSRSTPPFCPESHFLMPLAFLIGGVSGM